MVHWNPEPRADLHAGTLRVIRVPGERPVRGVVTSEIWAGCDTHFANGRTVPCEQPSCSLCSNGTPPRWHAYLALILHPTREHVLLELPLSAFPSLKTYLGDYQTIRAASLTAYRPSKRPNGRVLTSLDHSGQPPGSLPAAPDVKAILLRMWHDVGRSQEQPRQRKHRNQNNPDSPPDLRAIN